MRRRRRRMRREEEEEEEEEQCNQKEKIKETRSTHWRQGGRMGKEEGMVMTTTIMMTIMMYDCSCVRERSEAHNNNNSQSTHTHSSSSQFVESESQRFWLSQPQEAFLHLLSFFRLRIVSEKEHVYTSASQQTSCHKSTDTELDGFVFSLKTLAKLACSQFRMLMLPCGCILWEGNHCYDRSCVLMQGILPSSEQCFHQLNKLSSARAASVLLL